MVQEGEDDDDAVMVVEGKNNNKWNYDWYIVAMMCLCAKFMVNWDRLIYLAKLAKNWTIKYIFFVTFIGGVDDFVSKTVALEKRVQPQSRFFLFKCAAETHLL